MKKKDIGIALPKHESDRQKLRDLLPGEPLPAIYKEGADRPCNICGMILNVGPRLDSMNVDVVCPWCAKLISIGQEEEFDIISLGNPDSKPE